MLRLPTAMSLLLATLAIPSGVLAERFDRAAPLEQKPSGNYYLQVSLGPGVAREFLVDTGSGYVVLTSNTFAAVRDLPGTKHLRDITGRLANGRSARARIYRVARLTISESCTLEDVEVAILPGSTHNIFGLSALRRVAPFAMDLGTPSLLYSACDASAVAPDELVAGR